MTTRKPKTALLDKEVMEVEVSVNLWRATRRLDAIFAPIFATHGISNAQFNVLRILYVREGDHGVPCNEISQRLIHRIPDVTRLLDRLLRDGLIERQRCPLDRRVVRSRLTEKGQALMEDIYPVIMATHREAVSALSDDEQRELNRLLLQLNQQRK